MTWAIGYFLYPYLVEDGGSDLADFVMVPVALGILVLCLALARLSVRTRRAPALKPSSQGAFCTGRFRSGRCRSNSRVGNKMRKPASALSSSSHAEGRKTPTNGDGGNGRGESQTAGRRARAFATRA